VGFGGRATCFFFAQLVLSVLKVVTFQSGRDREKICAALAKTKVHAEK